MHSVVWLCALLLAILAGYLDWRSRRIPNWLTVPALALGIGLNIVIHGWHGTVAALEGTGLGLGLLLPFVLLRGLGAGDWKLMGALGALLGPVGITLVLLVSIFVSGLMAVVEMVRQNRTKETFVNLWVLVHATFTFGVRPPTAITLDNPKLMTLPFGIAVAMATVLSFLYGVWPRLA